MSEDMRQIMKTLQEEMKTYNELLEEDTKKRDDLTEQLKVYRYEIRRRKDLLEGVTKLLNKEKISNE